MNTVSLIGRLGNDPELRTTPNGKSVCEFRLAADIRRPRLDHHRDLGTDAETVAEHKRSGDQVAVTGRLTSQSGRTKPAIAAQPSSHRRPTRHPVPRPQAAARLGFRVGRRPRSTMTTMKAEVDETNRRQGAADAHWDMDDLDDALGRGGPPREECMVTLDGRRLETKDEVFTHLVDLGLLPESYRPSR